MSDFSELSRVTWKKSSYSSNAHACVEVAVTADMVGVRDTKDRRGGTLVVDRARWAKFVTSLKDGFAGRES